MEKQELLSLIDRHLSGQTSAEEEVMLQNYVNSFQQAGDTWDEKLEGSKSVLLAGVFSQLLNEIQPSTIQPPARVHRIHFLRRSFTRWAAAAVLLVAVLISVVMLQRKDNSSEALVLAPVNDVQPASKKAILTLADGSQVVLENLGDGQRIGQAIKTDGKLVYDEKGNQTKEAISFNTLTVPRGGQPQYVQLPDGTEVWLNTASSITYPTAFRDKTRKVEITGEAYFEVSKTGQSFAVQTRTDKIEVLGTHFNVNAYEDEGAVRTTLLEGKVKVASVLLQPGQQYVNGTVGAADTEQVIAWKNGRFAFDNTDVQTLMRQLGRWYDLNVRFEGTPIKKRFSGTIGRSLTLKQVLEGLQLSAVNYRLEANNKLVILP